MKKQTQINSAAATQITFGIEIETTIPNTLISQGLSVGPYHHGHEVRMDGFPRGWKCERDGSLHTNRSGYTCVEFVSPVLQGADGIAQVRQVLDWLDARGARTNRSCGTHIHVGVESGAGSSDANEQARWVANLINLTAQFEAALQGAAGSYWRASNSSYTGSVANDSEFENLSESVRRASKANKGRTLRNENDCDRYRTLNLCNLGGYRAKTVEFRCFSGTTDSIKAATWIQMVIALAERARGRNVKFNKPATTCYRGNGEAKKAIDRFCYLMGWTLGRKDQDKETVEVLGWIEDMDALKAAKKEIKRLAKRFDSDATEAQAQRQRYAW